MKDFNEFVKSVLGFILNALGVGFILLGLFLVYTIMLVVLIQFVSELSGWMNIGFGQLLWQWFLQIVIGLALLYFGGFLVVLGDWVDKSMGRYGK